jgi:thiamine-phosphate pyrophosphorylase
MRNIPHPSLYLVLSEEYAAGKPLKLVAEQAIAGGIDILQMREKQKSHDELLSLGNVLHGLCKKNAVLFIVNDDPFLAQELEADGVHLGQEDMMKFPVDKARHFLGRDKIIGLSTHSLEQFQKANQQDVDYIAFGPIFPTQTKDYRIGTGSIEAVLETAQKPVVLIGGISTTNLDVLLEIGATNVALIRDIMQAENITARAKWYKERLSNAKEHRHEDQG